MEKIFGISIIGIVVGIIIGIVSIVIPPLQVLAGSIFLISVVVLILTFFIEAAIYLLR